MKRSRFVAVMVAVTAVVSGLVLVSPAPSAQAVAFTPTQVRTQTALDSSWKFTSSDPAGAQATSFNDSAWSTVSLPHTWNGLDGQDGGGNNYRRGASWYRVHLTPAAALSGKQLWLDFGAASRSADVYVNGTLVGHHDGGFTEFRVNVTSTLVVGSDNVLAVRVDNTNDVDVAPNAPNFTISGGLIRGVSLLALNPFSITAADFGGPGVYVSTPSVSATSATVKVVTKLANNSSASASMTVHAVVTDATNTVVAENWSGTGATAAGATPSLTQTMTVANPHLWNGRADPYLYNTTVETFIGSTRVDSVTERIGIRSYSFSPTTGLTLNGSDLDIHGVTLNLDRKNKGFAASDADHVQDFQIMAEMGVNAIRSAHWPDSQKVFDLADEQGVLMYTELPIVNNITDSTAFSDNAKNQLREIIRQNYNRPSVLFWGLGNEIYGDTTQTNTFMQSIVDLADIEDPTRSNAYASCCNWDQSAFNGRFDLIGYNRYDGWYSGTSADLGTWADGLHAAKPTWKLGVTEYGAGGSPNQHAERTVAITPNSNFHSEENQARLHEDWYNQIKARPYIWGSFVFTMFDAAADDRNEGDSAGVNDKGLVTMDRSVKKDAFYWYKANWTATPFVHLNSARWTSRTSASTSVTAYANADNVTLTINGTQIGSPQSDANNVITWPNVTLATGANTVTVSGTRGGQTYTQTATWTVTP